MASVAFMPVMPRRLDVRALWMVTTVIVTSSLLLSEMDVVLPEPKVNVLAMASVSIPLLSRFLLLISVIDLAVRTTAMDMAIATQPLVHAAVKQDTWVHTVNGALVTLSLVRACLD